MFVGYDEYENPRYAGCRATNETRYMRDATGSDKRYSFRLENSAKTNKIHVFESAIDVLSFATILKLNNVDWRSQKMISLAGVYQPSKVVNNAKIPIAIEDYLKKNPQVTDISLHFDNDYAGREATLAFQSVIPPKYTVINAPSPNGKDINDYLCYRLGIKNNINKNRKEMVR